MDRLLELPALSQRSRQAIRELRKGSHHQGEPRGAIIADTMQQGQPLRVINRHWDIRADEHASNRLASAYVDVGTIVISERISLSWPQLPPTTAP
jgi:hypothetical protein